MEIADVLSIIGSYGFPICCCIYLIWNHRQESEKTAEEMEKLRKTVENNTIVMTKLCAKLGVDADVTE